MSTSPSPADRQPRVMQDFLAERTLRAELRVAVARLLSERQLSAPGPEEEARIRALIHEHIHGYQRRAAMTNTTLLMEPDRVEQRLFDDFLRLGILQPLIDDPEVEEIFVNHPARVFLIRDGEKELVQDLYFDDDDQVLHLVKRLIGPLGRRLDETSPMVDVRLPDGSRLNAAIPPATTRWTTLSIRKFRIKASSLEELVAFQTLTHEVASFLDAAVQAGINMVVSGPTGSGKTTFLNVLGCSIASLQERVITVEEVPELQLDQQLPDCVALQARAGNVEGAGEISIRELVRNALRMRPTRIFVGEVRGAEAMDMLQAMNTGHEGSMSTVHANSPRDALRRLVTLAAMAEERLSTETLREMVASTLELVIQLRFEPRTGRRRVSHVFELTGLETSASGEGVIMGNDLWSLDTERDRLTWTGIPPRCLSKIMAKGVPYVPPSGRS